MFPLLHQTSLNAEIAADAAHIINPLNPEEIARPY
jgi:hypothetical protein